MYSAALESLLQKIDSKPEVSKVVVPSDIHLIVNEIKPQTTTESKKSDTVTYFSFKKPKPAPTITCQQIVEQKT